MSEPAPQGLQSAQYLYDGREALPERSVGRDGTMVRGIVNGTITFYPGRHFNKEVAAGGTKVQKFYFAGTMTIAVRTLGNGTDVLKWVLGDHLGSTSATANADGSLNSVIQYTAYGEIRLTQGVTPTKYRYTGQLAQAELGLDYYVARWYDPVIGHFTQADTIIPEPGKASAFDRYAYVGNNPLRYVDPSGHDVGCAGTEADNCRGKNNIINRDLGYETNTSTLSNTIKPFQNPPIIVVPFTNKNDNDPKINPDNSIIIGYEYHINLDKLDYWDITISLLGIIGDIALFSTLIGNAPGPFEYGGTEALEVLDIIIKISDGYDLINLDLKSITLSTGETFTESVLKSSPISKKAATRVGSLIPILGIGFDLISIGIDFNLATDRIPIKAPKEEIITTQ